MVHSAPAKATIDAAKSPEAQHMISQLREMGLNVVAEGRPSGSSNPGLTAGLVSATVTNEDGTMSFACGSCSEYNIVNVAKGTWYVVTAGTSVGVFRDSALADSFVTGVKCSVRKKYSTLEAALNAFQVALSTDTVKLLQKD